MNKNSWIIPILIVAINALVIIVRWVSLPELLPAHFDLQGNAGDAMPRSMLVLYLLCSTAFGLISFVATLVKPKLKKTMVILASGVTLIVLLSTLVTLTSGTMPALMLAEPVVLLITLVSAVISLIMTRKK